jgi:hypothetical protein
LEWSLPACCRRDTAHWGSARALCLGSATSDSTVKWINFTVSRAVVSKLFLPCTPPIYGRDVNHSPPSSAKVVNDYELDFLSRPAPPQVCCGTALLFLPHLYIYLYCYILGFPW